MADERLLAPIRRFLNEEQVNAAYAKIFAAFGARLDDVTVIIGKSAGDDSASAQVVINQDDYLSWMDAFEVRLQEYKAEADGVKPVVAGTQHVQFDCRYVRT